MQQVISWTQQSCEVTTGLFKVPKSVAKAHYIGYHRDQTPGTRLVAFKAESFDTDLQRLFYSTWPPSLSSHLVTAKRRKWNPSLWSSHHASKHSHNWNNRSLLNAKYDAKIPKLYLCIRIVLCYEFTFIIQIVRPLFRWFLAISLDSDILRDGSGKMLRAKLDCCTFPQEFCTNADGDQFRIVEQTTGLHKVGIGGLPQLQL